MYAKFRKFMLAKKQWLFHIQISPIFKLFNPFMTEAMKGLTSCKFAPKFFKLFFLRSGS